MQSLGETTTGHHATGEFVDDDDLAVAHDVVLVALEQAVGLQRVVEMVHDGDVFDVVEGFPLQHAGFAQQGFHLLRTLFREGRGALLLVDLVVALLKCGHELVDGDVEIRTVLQRTRDDQRRAGLVDQDGIDLVDDGVGVAALHHLDALIFHVVAQIVEAELVVGGVGDVAGIGRLTVLVRQAVHDDAGGQAEKTVELAHPFGIAPGQIIVDGDDVHALAGQRVEIDGQRGDQRLALARLHLRDAAFVKDHAANQLNVEGAQAKRTSRGFAHGGKCRHQKVVDGRALFDLLSEQIGAGTKLFVGKGLKLGLERVDRVDLRPQCLDLPVVRGAEDLAGDSA